MEKHSVVSVGIAKSIFDLAHSLRPRLPQGVDPEAASPGGHGVVRRDAELGTRLSRAEGPQRAGHVGLRELVEGQTASRRPARLTY
jgi:hypothetical protein